MRVYAIHRPSNVLWEFKSLRELVVEDRKFHKTGTNELYEHVSATVAHRWVKNGWTHNTGLYLENGRIRYARAENN